MNFVKKFILFFLVIYDIKTTFGYGLGWWKYTTIYEVYIRSFKDSDGDGTGDLQGIISKLDHFVDLGIETLWISPFFKSPMLDLGYDISNYTAIDPLFGTMEDFDELMVEMKKRGLKLLIDFVMNHSSDDHQWFQNSIKKISPYTDYYIWLDPKTYDEKGNPVAPNNWLSLFGGSAWKWNKKRKQFYLHQFAEKQPDLNLRNPSLKAELKSILKFWFDKGVAGARLDATRYFIEDGLFRDEPLIDPNNNKSKSELDYHDYDHIYTADLWETYEYLHDLREFVDENCRKKYEEKILIVEAYTAMNATMLYYGTDQYKIVHFPFNFGLVGPTTYPSPKDMDKLIKNWLMKMPANGVANWVAENHDHARIGNLLTIEFSDIMLTILLTLPGVACVYYGQEIGMVDIGIRGDQIQDPNNDALVPPSTRDPERLPMQWDDSMNAGFTSNIKPWLPVNPDYWQVNVKAQRTQPKSRYNLYKTLSKLRQTRTLKYGNFKSYLISSWVYAYTRSVIGEPTYIVLINFGTETEMIHLHHNIRYLPTHATVLAGSLNAGYVPGNRLRTHSKFPQTIVLRPMSAMVLST